MNLFYMGMALFMLLNILVGMYRVYAGPKPRDRMTAAQLFGTTGVATLLLLAQALDSVYIQNAALVFALLMVMAVLAFVRNMSSSIDRDPDQ